MMFGHIFTYYLKVLLRTKEVVFWSLLYPIVLATFFNLAFGNLSSTERFEKINIAVVKSAETESGSQFYTALSSLSDLDGTASDDDMFHASLVSEEEADKLLDTGKISGYVFFTDNSPSVCFRGSGFGQTILKAFTDSYIQSTSTVTEVLKKNPNAINEGLLDKLKEKTEFVAEKKGNNPDTTVIYFYTLLAMTCLFAATVGVQEIIKIQANLSALGSRINLAPVYKFKVFLYSLAAAALFQFVVCLAVLAFVIFVLGIDFGQKTGLIILTCGIGTLTGLFFGTFVGAVIKKGEGVKYAVVISVTMFCSFLSGMMGADMKYIVQEKAPLLGFLNPVNLITDAFYSLFYYDGFERFYLNIAILLAFSAVFCVFTCLVLRRQKYASI